MKIKFIESIGVEVEGGICISDLEKLSSKYRDRFSFSRDASVYVQKPQGLSCSWLSNAEVKYWAPIAEINMLKQFIIDTFNVLKQNETCGNHVHMLLKKPYCLLIITPEFIKKFQAAYKAYALERKNVKKYMDRIKNRYCQFANDSYDIVENINGENRYYAVNYAALYAHNTIEFRILPHVRNAKEYLRNLRWLIMTVEKIISELTTEADSNILIFDDSIEIPDPDDIIEMVEGEI